MKRPNWGVAQEKYMVLYVMMINGDAGDDDDDDNDLDDDDKDNTSN